MTVAIKLVISKRVFIVYMWYGLGHKRADGARL